MAEPFNPGEAFNFFRNMWKPLETPMQTMFAGISPEEVDKKIAELKTVENWLTVNLSMLQVSIKTLELQKAALAAMNPPDKGEG